MAERSSCNRWRFAAGGPERSDAARGAPSASLVRSSALAGSDDFESSPPNSRYVGSKVSISGLLRWRGNWTRSPSRVLEGLYPQTEIRSNEQEGARLEFEMASEQRALNRCDRSLIHWWKSKLGFLTPLSPLGRPSW